MGKDPDSWSPKRLSEDELNAIEAAIGELRRIIAAGDFFEVERIMQHPELDAFNVGQLISEVRRLRTLVRDTAICLDGLETSADPERGRRLRQVQVRLKVEVDRT